MEVDEGFDVWGFVLGLESDAGVSLDFIEKGVEGGLLVLIDTAQLVELLL